MIYKYLVLTIFFITTSLAQESAPTIKSSYDLKDLQILANQRNYLEFFAHIFDMRPSQRDDNWKKLIRLTGIEYSDVILGEVTFDPSKFDILFAAAVQTAELKNDPVFQNSFFKNAQKYFSLCFAPSNLIEENINTCKRKLSDLWNAIAPLDAKFSFFMAKLLRDSYLSLEAKKLAQVSSHAILAPHLSLQQLLKQWLTPAIKSSLSDIYCKEPWVQDYLLVEVKDLLINPELSKPGSEFSLLFSHIANRNCYLSWRDYLFDSLNSQDSELKKIAFQILRLDDGLEKGQKDFLHVMYLLQGPEKSDLFNYSWGTLKTISFDSTRRTAVLEKLKKLDPLPDQLFNAEDELKVKVLIKEFEVRFPEWLDYYAKTCLGYLKGEINNPNGNPTINCKKYYYYLKKEKYSPSLETVKSQFSPYFK